jgi:hypothetical protein
MLFGGVATILFNLFFSVAPSVTAATNRREDTSLVYCSQGTRERVRFRRCLDFRKKVPKLAGSYRHIIVGSNQNFLGPSVESIAQQSPRAVFRLFSRLSTTMGVCAIVKNDLGMVSGRLMQLVKIPKI